MSAYSPVSGSAVKVWPSGTRGRPVKVGPCRPGERGSRAILYLDGKKRASRSTKPRWPASQSARPSARHRGAVRLVLRVLRRALDHALAVGRLVGAHRAERVLLAAGVVDQRALRRAGGVGLGEVLGEVGEEVVEGVADRHVRAVEAQLRVERGDGGGEAAQRRVGAGRLGQLAQLDERLGRLLVERRQAPLDRRADLDRVVERRQRALELLGGAREVLREGGQVGEERALDPERADARVHRRRRLGDEVLERLLVAAERLEGVGHAGEQRRVLAGHRGDDAGGVAELLHEAVEVGPGLGQRGHHRLERAHERRQLLERAADRLRRGPRTCRRSRAGSPAPPCASACRTSRRPRRARWRRSPARPARCRRCGSSPRSCPSRPRRT